MTELLRPQGYSFDPNGVGDESGGIFGLPYTVEDANLVLLPVPWEATTSYGRGTSRGPQAVREASPQLDLFDYELGKLGLARPWEFGIALESEDPWIVTANEEASRLALPIIEQGGCSGGSAGLEADLQRVNQLSEQLQVRLADRVRSLRQQGKLVGVLGGDHSTPLGVIQAFSEEFPGLGVLQIDAHADLRVAYEGFVQSHASIMHNVLEQTSVSRVVQVGIRDLCEAEFRRIEGEKRLRTFFDSDLQERLMLGDGWDALCTEVVEALPEYVYVSFDIDGLEPVYCPHTGTPVAGGLSFVQATHLLRRLVTSGRKMVGFDLNEVAPGADQWDGNVGARLLYRLSGLLLWSHGARDVDTV